MFSIYLAMYAVVFTVRGVSNGIWRQPLRVTRPTIARALSGALPQRSFALLYYDKRLFVFVLLVL